MLLQNSSQVAAGVTGGVLGDLLWTDPVDPALGALPSPNFLKNKILIKAKRIRLTANGSIDIEGNLEDFMETPKGRTEGQLFQ